MSVRPLRFLVPAALLLAAAGCSTAPAPSATRLCEAQAADCQPAARTTRTVEPVADSRPARDLRRVHPGTFALGAAVMMF